MSLLWENYVFRRGSAVFDLWDSHFSSRNARVLYIAGCGFDVRVTAVLEQFLKSVDTEKYPLEEATLLLIEFTGYELDQELEIQTKENSEKLEAMYREIGEVIRVPMLLMSPDGESRTTHALRDGIKTAIDTLRNKTDIILDVSSLPRVVYLALMTSILVNLVPNREKINCLSADSVAFQVLVGEDAALDGKISSEDPSDDLVAIPGFGGGINVESMNDWPVVWFPVLGEGRTGQFEKVVSLAGISDDAEVCPVIPHPSKDPRRGDKLLVEYRVQLFDSRDTPMTNIVYAHESHPFEAYRQISLALDRYRSSLAILGGCRLLVTPLASKLMTVAVGLACFEMRPPDGSDTYALGIPCAAPTRYVANRDDLRRSQPELSALMLTGDAYRAE